MRIERDNEPHHPFAARLSRMTNIALFGLGWSMICSLLLWSLWAVLVNGNTNGTSCMSKTEIQNAEQNCLTALTLYIVGAGVSSLYLLLS